MYTFQDFQAATSRESAIRAAISHHMSSAEYKTAVLADAYDRQQNPTINQYVKTIQDYSGNPMVNAQAANAKIASNFFYRLNTQLNSYLLGNGVTFAGEDGEALKERLGADFDTAVAEWAYYARIHGSAYGYWAVDKLHVFKLTEFVPLLDETTGQLRAGLRFWSLDWGHKPQTIVVYEEDGYSVWQSGAGDRKELHVIEEKHGYKQIVATSAAGGEILVGEENYGALPIIPMYGSRLKQSTLVGKREAIDSYDLIQSGFANDLLDCAQIYWIIENCGGMTQSDLQEFLTRIRVDHVATADTQSMGVESSSLKPYTQDIPFTARQTYLDSIRKQIYESFGGLDTEAISAAAKTATEINAAYQNLDQEADALELQAIRAINGLLALLGETGTPTFKRARITNEMEQTQMVISAAQFLDQKTVLQKLPFVTVDEVNDILEQTYEENAGRFDKEPFGDEMNV